MGIILALILFWKHLPKPEMLEMFNSAAITSVTVIINTAIIVGFGSVGQAKRRCILILRPIS